MGTDALRFTLLVGSTPGNDANLSLKKVEANRNFANKVWNIGRFVIGALESAPAMAQSEPQWTLADSWVWARMHELIRSVERLFDNHQYGEAGRQIYDFMWGDFADWYVEIAKLQLAAGGDRAYYTAFTLVRVLDNCLRLLHPFTPFVTEELWGHLKNAAAAHSDGLAPKAGWEEALIKASWPAPQPLEGWEEAKTADFILFQEVVRAIRNLRAEKKVVPGKRIPAVIAAGDRTPIFESLRKALAALGFLDSESLEIVPTKVEKAEDAVSLVVMGIEILLPLAGMVDDQAEKARIEKELTEAESHIARLEALLESDFAKKAPPALVDKERQKLATYKETAEKLRK
jgi:valyl-tRNA synthetase